MDANSSSEHVKVSPTKNLTEPPKSGKEETRERKFRFRHLTDEMLEKYRRMSEDSDLWQRQYEEAAFKVYGTLPARKISFQAAAKKEGKQEGLNNQMSL